MLECRIEEKPQFTVMGLSKMFCYNTSYQEIPKFWQEVLSVENPPVWGMYGVCIGGAEKEFEYLIADDYAPCKPVPEGCITKVIPASTWAIFPCRGPIPQVLQSVNTEIWSQWLPNNKDYRLAANMDLEFYTPPTENPEDNYSEIWLPVERI
jgi:AraC family transcriptional regulator